MTLHNPPHPGHLVGHDCLAPLGLSLAAAARGLGISRSRLAAVIAGKSRVKTDLALRLEAVGWGSAAGWLRMQSTHDLWQLRQKPNHPAQGLKPLGASKRGRARR